ncbi:FtsW/RodA/SpoVE family cell cycle protein [Cryptosporangium sp. NPDC051539]|uniref:FtsW/RodA/SpoVE family cell cycle protein n=1 Tax=Cryptosporangium sp. NPDC051539 TaxID=3363962 RepID=UPI0037B63356
MTASAAPRPAGGADPALTSVIGRPDRPLANNSRNTELILLIVSLVVVSGMSLAVQGSVLGEISLSALALPGLLALVFLGAHLAVRVLAPYADPLLLPAVATINGISVVFIRRLDLGRLTPDERIAAGVLGGEGSEALKQYIWAVVAILGFVALLAVVRDHRTLARFGYIALFTGLILVLLPAVLPSSLSEINGAKLWIIIPGIGQIQPGEFAKIALLLYFARILVDNRDFLQIVGKFSTLKATPRFLFDAYAPMVSAWLVSLGVLMFEKDLGTSLLYFGLFLVMIYIATNKARWVAIGLVMFMIGAYAAYLVVSRVQLRVEVWLHPFDDPFDKGYQIVQSLLALGSGGLFGAGPGAGSPNILSLYASTDFVFAAIGEEIGLFGLTALLVLYALIASRGIRAGLDVRDSYGKLLAGGLAFSITLQTFVIVGGVTKLIPLTGLTTPFLAYGGSSLIANWLIIGLLIRISDAGRRPAKVKAPPLQLRDAPTEVVRL